MDKSYAEYCIEAHEFSSTGTPHIQGFVRLKKAMSEKQMHQLMPRASLFVTKGTDYQNFLYCAKGEQDKTEWEAMKETGPNWGLHAEFLEYGERPKEPGPSHKKKPNDFTFQDALAAPTVREGMEIIKKRKARDYCLHGASIERHLKMAKTAKFSPKYLLSDFNHVPLDLSKSVLITGRSGTGKTQFALAHFKNPLLVSHVDKLKTLTPDHDGIVFDDMAFNHWPPESVIHLLDIELERELHVRWGTVTIPSYVKKIFTTNKPNPFYDREVDEEQRNAIERRYKRIDVSQPLFGADTVFGPAALNAYNVMVGGHRPVPNVPLPPERFPIHAACAPLIDPRYNTNNDDDWHEPGTFSDDEGDMNQVD